MTLVNEEVDPWLAVCIIRRFRFTHPVLTASDVEQLPRSRHTHYY